MYLRNLQTFVQVAETGSFTEAGETLGYSQPTISFQIKKLEQELGVQLFERIGHNVSLTIDGQKALAYAQQICHLSQEMLQASDSDKEIRGTVRLAMADSLCSPLIVKQFSDFRSKYSNISLMVTTAGTGDLFRMLDHNDVDVVCTLDARIYNTSYVISAEEIVGAHVVCSVNHPLASLKSIPVTLILNEPFLMTERGMSYRRLFDEFLALHSLEIHPILEMGNADLICQLVAKNTGLSFLPDYVTEHLVQAGQIVRLDIEDFSCDLWGQLIYRKDKWLSAPVQAVVEYFSHHIPGFLQGKQLYPDASLH